ncbi:glycoside hydrolase family 13 protein [Tetragenococcus halophilus]|uniref:glycoside hydrolase family 13 protein n=1 Tax=Tetragenococcus halophilus TaxID=51669 RepID=UPI000B928BC0|nr:glycoside hydrolase family 13 protein [Tetragenococcus halophilus]
MLRGSIYHRSESEYAYLYTSNKAHIRIRTGRNDVSQVLLMYGDPYTFNTKDWTNEPLEMELLLSTENHDYWFIEVEPKFKRLQYGFHLIGKDGEEVFYGDKGVFPYQDEFIKLPNLYFKIPYFHDIDRFKAPSWVRDTVWYQIFPERFCNGDKKNDPKEVLPWNSKLPSWNDFFGGDIAGIISKLDYLHDLGVNGLYLCPIFIAPSNHKYDTTNYFEIDPHFGDKELFRKFIEVAHEKGFKIMLDAVFNHIGDDSPQWKDVLAHGSKSRYADWFHINEFPVNYSETEDFEYANDITYDTFAFTSHMPKLNTANEEVQDYLLDIAKYWVKEFNIDAWRLDVANEIDHHFWKKFHEELCSLKEDFYILGEVWNSAQPWLGGDEFHGSMNYAYTEIIEQYFAQKQLSSEKFISLLNEQLMTHRQQTNAVMMNMMDSHDTPRITTVCKEDIELMHTIMAFMFMQPGSPCIYYGTEIAMKGGPDPDCRRCMDWSTDFENNQTFNFMRQLVHFRKENAEVLSNGKMEWRIFSNGDIKLTRQLGKKRISVLFNKDKKIVNGPNYTPILAGKQWAVFSE